MNKVSITIPTKNEEAYIAKCLQSIVESDYPKENLQIFVCDGLSNDNTQKIVKEFEQKYEYIHLLINEKETTPYALNLGLKAAKADYKIILGAHSEISPDFISQNVKTFEQIEDEKLACVGGILENIYENESSELIGLAMSSPFGVGNAHFRTGTKYGYVDTVAFGCYKSEIFDKIGYFDESLARNQDDEFNFRLLKNGYKIYLSDKIKSKYYVRASYQKLFKQYYQYGYWKVVVNNIYNQITTFRQIVPGLFVLFLFFGVLTSLFSLALAILYFFIVSIYIFSSYFAALKFRINFKTKLKVMKAFFILHFSYGLGYLMALKDLLFLQKFRTKKQTEISR